MNASQDYRVELLKEFHRGDLVDLGFLKYGLDSTRFFQCYTCQTLYPVIDGDIWCNGMKIEKCPYC